MFSLQQCSKYRSKSKTPRRYRIAKLVLTDLKSTRRLGDQFAYLFRGPLSVTLRFTQSASFGVRQKSVYQLEIRDRHNFRAECRTHVAATRNGETISSRKHDDHLREKTREHDK